MPTPRALTPADSHAYFALRQAALVDSPWAFTGSPSDDIASDPEAVASLLAQKEQSILAIDDDADPARLVASAGVMRQQRLKTRHRALIWGVYCDPSVRGRGCGRAVVQAAIETARSWPGVEIVTLSVSANATAAKSLYESLGFTLWGTEPDAIRVGGRSYDEFHMTLRL